MSSRGGFQQATRAYIGARWNGRIPPRRLVWWEVLTVGTLVNAVAGLASLILLTRGIDGGTWVALHFLLLPYNVFLLLAVWRTARAGVFHRALAVGWFGCTLLV